MGCLFPYCLFLCSFVDIPGSICNVRSSILNAHNNSAVLQWLEVNEPVELQSRLVGPVANVRKVEELDCLVRRDSEDFIPLHVSSASR